MKFLIVGLVKSPLLARLVVEGEKRGHSVDGCYVSELTVVASNTEFTPTLRGKSLDYDLVALWSLGKRRWEWYVTAEFLNDTKDTVIVNSKVVDKSYNLYLSPLSSYLKQMNENIPFPKSAAIFSKLSIPSIIGSFAFPVIVKSSQGRQGRGVFKADDLRALNQNVGELENAKEAIIVREFIPNDGDIRVFTVGYKAIGAMKRTPPAGDFRSNISVGGEGEYFDLDENPEIKNLAEKASKITKTEIAGVDIMIHKETGKPYILEVNPGPQFTGLEKYAGVNAAAEIVKYFESRVSKSISQ